MKQLNCPNLFPSGNRLFSVLLAVVFLAPHLAAATLSGSFTPLPAGTNINLTAEGKLDWVHWGLGSGWSVERKYGIQPQITNTFIADPYYADGPYQLTNGPVKFTWSDGTPVLAVTRTPTDVEMNGDRVKGGGTGFQIQCLADTTLKKLRIYVGTSGAAGTLTASLSGATTYTDSSLGGIASNGVYTINFQANSAGQTLTVTFTSSDLSGYLFLQAATLSGPDVPPSVMLTAPNGTTFSAPAGFLLAASASDSDGTVTNLAILNGATFLASTNTGTLSVTVTNEPGGSYNFVAVATDNAGLSVTSFPVNVFVTTGGGVLSGSVAVPPASVNLTSQGTLDWAHWGLSSAASFDHKSGVTQIIPNVTPVNATTGNILQYSDNLTAYTWSDGTPTTSASGSTTGIFLYSTNNPPGAFELTVPATNSLRRLNVYVGLYGEQARMQAWLSDSSAPAYSDASLSSAYNDGYAVYSFFYSSTNKGATLNVLWSPQVIYDPFYGNATWQAATLSIPPPAPILTGLNLEPSGNFNFSFLTQTDVNYTVFSSGSLSPAAWQAMTNFPGTGTNVIINDNNANPPGRFYRVQAQ